MADMEVTDTNIYKPATEPAFSLPNIAARFFDTPLLIEPSKAKAIAWALGEKLGLKGLQRPAGDVMEVSGTGLLGQARDPRTGYYVDSGVAVIPIHGTLVNRGAWIGTFSGLTSYEGLARQLDWVARDDRVSAVMFDVDSFGGEATGVDDTAEMIRALDKPTYAMIDGAGSSAAYWLSSACDRVYIGRSSHGGSIGVVLTHYDFSRAADEAGVTVTHIHAGADKVLGSPFKSLSDSDREKLQAKVDTVYRSFVEAVSTYRGMSTEDVRATEAAVFDGAELVEKGLANGITTGRRLLAAIQEDFEDPDPDREPEFVSGASRANAQTGGNSMSTENRTGGADTAAETFTQADMDAMRAEGAKAGLATGRKQERERIAAIFCCDAAEKRPKLANHLALETETSAEDAEKLLAAAAEEGGKVSALSEAMAGASPGVSSDVASEAADETEAAVQAILNA